MNQTQEIKQQTNNFSITFKLAFSASMISLATILSFVSSLIKIPFLAQLSLTIDISIICIIPLIFICSLSWANLSGVAIALLNFVWDAHNWIGILILLVANVVTTTLFYLLYKATLWSKKLAHTKRKWIIIWLLIIIINTLVFTILNGIIFTPLYWWWFAPNQFSLNFIEVEKIYNSNPYLHVYLLGIPDYWTGIFALYSILNLIKFTAVAFFSTPTLFYFQKYSLTANLFV